MTPPGPTPSQTVGPYFAMRLGGNEQNILAGPQAVGRRIRIEGFVLDGDRNHIEDALVEIWQADAAGHYRHAADTRDHPAGDPEFSGFGRAATDFGTGAYWFETIMPGPVPEPEGEHQAPHVNVVVQGRGMLNPVFTRMYFSDHAEANATDLILAMVPAERRHTMVAELVDDGEPPVYRFDIRFQGGDETVFLEF